MEPLVRLEHISKQFPGESKLALSDITTTINRGRIVGLVGPDGAGKTTLIRILTELLLPTSGTLLSHVDRSEIGYMPQKFGLYEDLTVQQNLNLYADLQGVLGQQRKERFESLFSFTNLKPFRDRLAGKLSGGMKQKLGLACVLIKTPKLLVLDEPSVGVDPISRRELWKMVHQLLHEDITVLWSTSYLDEAARCDDLLLLNDGKLLFSGTPQEFTGGAKSFEDAYIKILGGSHVGPSILAATMPALDVAGKTMIEVQNLTKRFGSFCAVDDISLKIPAGEIFGLLGPNGAGKSTTFKMMCGLLPPTNGSAYVNGKDLAVAPGEARSHIGYMAQKFSLYDNLNVRQNLDFFAGIYNLEGRKKEEAIDQMIDIFGLKDYLKDNAGILPLGIKQRLALSCSLMHKPLILFLDEPTSGVDPLTRQEFWNHIRGLVSKGVTIMITTHFMDEAEYCDKIGLVYRGRLIAKDSPDALKKKAKVATLEDAFIHHIEEYDKAHPL